MTSHILSGVCFAFMSELRPLMTGRMALVNAKRQSDDAALAKSGDLVRVHFQQFAKDLLCVLA